MANFCYNYIRIENDANAVKMFNSVLKKKIKGDKVPTDLEGELNNLHLSLDCFNPMPQTFKDFDTTNSMRNFDSFCYWAKEHDDKGNFLLYSTKAKEMLKGIDFNSLPEEGKKKLYKEYVKGWIKAKEHQEEKYGVVGWYDWGVKYRGTKWDAELQNIEINDDYITADFETAWSAPDKWIEFVSKKFKISGDMHCAEEAYDFIGDFIFGNGETSWIEDEHKPFSCEVNGAKYIARYEDGYYVVYDEDFEMIMELDESLSGEEELAKYIREKE